MPYRSAAVTDSGRRPPGGGALAQRGCGVVSWTRMSIERTNLANGGTSPSA